MLSLRVWRADTLKAPLRVKTRNLADIERWLNTRRYVYADSLNHAWVQIYERNGVGAQGSARWSIGD